jgi:hypothetical protein
MVASRYSRTNRSRSTPPLRGDVGARTRVDFRCSGVGRNASRWLDGVGAVTPHTGGERFPHLERIHPVAATKFDGDRDILMDRIVVSGLRGLGE